MKRAALFGVLLAVAFALSSQTPRSEQAGRPQESGRGAGRGRGQAPRVRKTVLAWADTRNGQAQHDSVSHALSIIERLGYESGAYDTVIRTDSHIISRAPQKTTGEPASGGPPLNKLGAIFFFWYRHAP